MNKYATEIKWGGIFTVASLLWLLLEKSLGWHDEHIDKHPLYTNLFAIVAIAVYVLALREKRKRLGGAMTWKQGFYAGLLISVVVMVLSPLAQWIAHTFITPDYFENAIAYAVEHGKATREQAESFFNLRSYMVQSAVFALVVGAVTSAIVALFVRRKAA
ncbi:MAG: DUF4199 domain-containing protein [Bacteroidetes bacterium]|nr:MAG: DUF4199 domain-containing protein [Bacteroidota bacterium]